MSAISADGVADLPRAKETGRVRRFLKKARHKIASGARRTWNAVKKAAGFTGRTATRTVGTVGAVGLWLIKALLIAAALAITLLLAVPALVAFVIVIALYCLTQLYEGITRYMYLPMVWLAMGRPVKYSAFKEGYRSGKTEKGARRIWSSVSDKLREAGVSEEFLADHDAEAEVDEEGTILVSPIKIKRAPLTDLTTIDDEELRRNLAGFAKVAADFVRQTQESPTLHIPGVIPTIPVEVPIDPESALENPEDPFSNEGSMFQPNFEPIREFFASKELAVEYDFSRFLNDPETLLMSYAYLRDSSGNLIEERSYWMGRHEMLRHWMEMPSKAKKAELATEHGRVWGLVHAQLFRQQDLYSLKHVGAGLKAQAAELNPKTAASR